MVGHLPEPSTVFNALIGPTRVVGGAGASFPAIHRDLLGAVLAPEELTANLGRVWSIESGYQKSMPAANTATPS